MNIIQEFDTIAAIATPIGTGGVGVIRISGDKSFEIIDKIYSRHNLEAGKISHGWIMDNGKKTMEGTPREIFSQVEKMKKIGLDVPQVTELAYELNKEGVNISTDILNIDEMVSELCQLK